MPHSDIGADINMGADKYAAETPSHASIKALRTPDARFADLPDFDYPVEYADDLPGYQGLRAAWIDIGPKNAEHVFLCLHGEPSWSYLYRRMIPVFVEVGARVVAPDFFGFGRSDKPIETDDYSFDFFRNHILALVERLDLRNISLVVQDWGGLVGLTLPVDPQFCARFRNLIVMNTGLGTGKPAGKGFMAWREYALNTPDMKVGELIARGTPHLTPREIAAYDAPFPSPEYKAGVRIFPALVPISPKMDGVKTSLAAASYWSEEFSGESFMAIGAADPVLGEGPMRALHAKIRGCPEPLVIGEGGHFLQEWGEPIARAALRHFGLLG